MLKTDVTAKLKGREDLTRINQAGVALLQILMITMVISLLAINFTKLAREQVDMAAQFEHRVIAQLDAYSALNELIFLQLSESIENVGEPREQRLLALSDTLNLYGAPIDWRKGVVVKVQDLNGLLPQQFPQHPLWRAVLKNYGLNQTKIDHYLGVWEDIQDPDNESWEVGEKEPLDLPTGQRYLNGFAQTDHVLRWVFADDPELMEMLLSISNVISAYDMNPLNAPDLLLSVLFDPAEVNEMVQVRANSANKSVLLQLLPLGMASENIYIHNSSKREITVTVKNALAEWQETIVVSLDAAAEPPFNILQKK